MLDNSLAHIHTGDHTSKTTPTHTYTRHVTITSSTPAMNNPSGSEVTDCNQEQFALLQKKNQHRWVFLPILTQTDSNTCDSHVVWGETRWNETRQPPQCWAHFLRLRREKYKTRIIHRLDRHDTAFILLTQTLFSKYRFQKETDLFLNNHILYYFLYSYFSPV